MTEERLLKIIIRAIDTYGYEAQLKMAIEEMSELTKAICKLWRADTEEELERLLEDVAEETADVSIMLLQVGSMAGSEEVDRIMNEKLERLEARLNAKEKGERDNEKS